MTILSKISVTAANFDFEVKKFLQYFMAVDTVAAAGSVSTDATLLASNRNVVTAANGTKGVILLPASVDMAVEVVNTVADQDLLVYPANGEQINALTVTTGAFTIPGGSYTVFLCDANKHWYVAAKFSPDVLDMTGATGVPEIHLSANRADALSMEDTTGDIFSVATTTGALAFNFDKDVQVNVGVSASVTGSGFPLSATRTLAMGVYSDDNDAAISSGTLTRAGRFRNLQTYTGGNREQEAVGLIGQLVSVAGTNRHNMAGLMGSYEGSGALTIDGQAPSTDPWVQAGVVGRVGLGSGTTTINSNGRLSALAAMSNTTSFLANNGVYAGLYVGHWGSLQDFSHGIYIESDTTAIGIYVGDTSGNSIQVANTNIASGDSYSGLRVAVANGDTDISNEYGIAAYFDSTLNANTGTDNTGHLYNVGSWINFGSGYTPAADKIHVPFEGGIYDGGGTLTNARLVFGGQHQAILSGSPASLHAWRLNTAT